MADVQSIRRETEKPTENVSAKQAAYMAAHGGKKEWSAPKVILPSADLAATEAGIGPGTDNGGPGPTS